MCAESLGLVLLCAESLGLVLLIDEGVVFKLMQFVRIVSHMPSALASPSFTTMRDILFIHSEYHLDYGHAGCYAV